MVLLKRYGCHIVLADTATFTFHYGLIKTAANHLEYDDKIPFTFHYGLIKTWCIGRKYVIF